MVELGELERRHEDFAARGVRIVVVSNDDQEESRKTQADFPHLVVIADTEQQMAQAVDVVHPGAGQIGEDTNAPTTFLLDGEGSVRWIRRTGQIMVRPSPDELLEAIDTVWPSGGGASAKRGQATSPGATPAGRSLQPGVAGRLVGS